MVAETLLLLNPRKRRKSHKRRTAAQRAATKKLVALMRLRRVKRNPSRSKKRHIGAFAMNHRRKYRRNPSSRRGSGVALSANGAMGVIKPALSGAAGALAVNLVMNQVATSLPAPMIDGKMLYVTKAAAAILLGYVGGKMPGIRPYARSMAQGSLTVTLADLGKDLAAGAGINLSGLSYVNPGWIASPNVAGRGNASLPGTMGRAAGMNMYLPNPMQRAAQAARMNGMAQYISR